MDTIIFATGNKNKMIEIRMILADLGCKILSQKEAGIQADVVEDGQTFEENALFISPRNSLASYTRRFSIPLESEEILFILYKIQCHASIFPKMFETVRLPSVFRFCVYF